MSEFIKPGFECDGAIWQVSRDGQWVKLCYIPHTREIFNHINPIGAWTKTVQEAAIEDLRKYE